MKPRAVTTIASTDGGYVYDNLDKIDDLPESRVSTRSTAGGDRRGDWLWSVEEKTCHTSKVATERVRSMFMNTELHEYRGVDPKWWLQRMSVLPDDEWTVQESRGLVKNENSEEPLDWFDNFLDEFEEI